MLTTLQHAATLVLLASTTLAADVEYITDIFEYTLLPPCVAEAVSYAIAAESAFGDCVEREGQTELQECICSNTARHSAISSSIVSDVSSSCGRSATDDQQSASKMYEKYCDPEFEVDFQTPTTNIVNAYITDLKEMAWLAPCASAALSGAVMAESQSRCPTDASLMAPCVCSKRGVAQDVRTTISRSVRYSCSNNEDVTSAYDFFDEYCAMNDGTTNFAKPESPPGDMSYYITALPQYSSLEECAQSALSSVVLAQTHWRCASGPQALASCVCLKSAMSNSINRDLTSEVKNLCDNTATNAVSSAEEVWDFFCSAVNNEAVAQVTESIPQTASAGTAEPHSGSQDPSPSETGAENADPQSNEDNNGSGGSGVNRTAVIVGAVLGGLIGVALIVGIVLFIRRKKNAKAQHDSPSTPPDYRGHPELDGSSSEVGPGKTDVSEGTAELPPDSLRPELQAHSHGDRLIPFHQPHEMDGTAPTGWSAHSPTNNVSPLSPEERLDGANWQPRATEAYEIDSTPIRG